MLSLYYAVEMARAFEAISRAFSRLRIGSRSSANDNMDRVDSLTNERHPNAGSSRRSEKRKISSATTSRESEKSNNSRNDITDSNMDTSTEPGVAKRRRTPADVDSGLGCARSIDDLAAHTLVFRVRAGSVGSRGAAQDDIGLNRKISENMSESNQDLRIGKNPSNECRISCEMGDVWTQAYYEKPLDRHTQIKTGNEFTDRILPAIAYKGYAPQKILAKGEFSSVLMAGSNGNIQQELSRRFIAVKFLDNPAKSQGILHPWQNDIPDEVRMLKKLHHDNIVELIDFWPIHGRQAIALEYCPHGNIQDLIEKRPSGFLSEVTSRRYFKDMHAAVEYLHLQCVVHRDITTKHFLIDAKDRVKLTDFRCAQNFKIGDDFVRDCPGNQAYQPPEYQNSTEPFNPRGADVWALGLVLYSMLTGRLPRDPEEPAGTKWQDLRVPFPDQKVLYLSSEVQYLLKGMLSSLTEARFTMNRVRCSDWLQQKSDQVSIGSFHLVREPRKLKAGSKEEERKMEFDL